MAGLFPRKGNIRRFRSLCVAGVSACALLAHPDAQARRDLIPQRPSVELNLEVLDSLTVSAVPFETGISQTVLPAVTGSSAPSSPAATAASSPWPSYTPAPTSTAAPYALPAPSAPAAPSSGYATYSPVPAAASAPAAPAAVSAPISFPALPPASSIPLPPPPSSDPGSYQWDGSSYQPALVQSAANATQRTMQQMGAPALSSAPAYAAPPETRRVPSQNLPYVGQPAPAAAAVSSGAMPPMSSYQPRPMIESAPATPLSATQVSQASAYAGYQPMSRRPQLPTPIEGRKPRPPVSAPASRPTFAKSAGKSAPKIDPTKPIPPVIHDEPAPAPTPAPAPKPAPVATPVSTPAPVSVPSMPDVPPVPDTPAALPPVSKLSEPGPSDLPPLPEPDSNMQFDDFPKLEPMPDMPPVPAAVPSPPPSAAPAPSAEPVAPAPLMPSLNKGFDDFISKDEQPAPSSAPAPALPPLPSASAEVPMEDTELPALPQMPSADAQVPSMPEIPDSNEVELAGLPPQPDVALPPLAMPGADAMPFAGEQAPQTAGAGAGGSLLKIDFAPTENEVPVAGQKSLSQLAGKLMASNQPVVIRSYIRDTEDSSGIVGNRVAGARAFAVRSFLIDKGVSHFNISIDNNLPKLKATDKEYVEIVTK